MLQEPSWRSVKVVSYAIAFCSPSAVLCVWSRSSPTQCLRFIQPPVQSYTALICLLWLSWWLVCFRLLAKVVPFYRLLCTCMSAALRLWLSSFSSDAARGLPCSTAVPDVAAVVVHSVCPSDICSRWLPSFSNPHKMPQQTVCCACCCARPCDLLPLAMQAGPLRS